MDQARGYPPLGSRRRVERDLEPAVMTTPVVTETRRNGNPIRPRPQLPPAA
jgi:hypothetical protein